MNVQLIELNDGQYIMAVPSHVIEKMDEAEVFALYYEAWTQKFGEASVEAVMIQFNKGRDFYNID